MNGEKELTLPQNVDEVFRENSGAILEQMTQVLVQFGINGYSVRSFQIGLPPRDNPDICIPCLHRVHDFVFELKCSYISTEDLFDDNSGPNDQ